MLSEELTAHTNEIDGDQLNIKLGGTVDGSSLTALVGEVSGMVDDTLAQIAAILEAAGLTGLLTIDEDDQGNITVSFNVDGLTGSGGYKGGGGGGGGGGKSAAQEFLEKLNFLLECKMISIDALINKFSGMKYFQIVKFFEEEFTEDMYEELTSYN